MTSIKVRRFDGKFRFLQHSEYKDVTIREGESLSEDSIDIQGYHYMAIVMPAEWTNAKITFQASYNPDNGTFKDVYDDEGNEIEISVSADKVVVLAHISEKTKDSANLLGPLHFIKLRSGTSGTPVTQGDDRHLRVMLSR